MFSFKWLEATSLGWQAWTKDESKTKIVITNQVKIIECVCVFNIRRHSLVVKGADGYLRGLQFIPNPAQQLITSDSFYTSSTEEGTKQD